MKHLSGKLLFSHYLYLFFHNYRKGRLYLVFEFMDRNLLEVLEEKPDGLDRDSVRYFIYQLLKACDYFHSQNVMHRDIKPENLLISSKTNKLKVCDFGFARHID